MRPRSPPATARYHVDVAVVGSGIAPLLSASLLSARGVPVALLGDPARALTYELPGFSLPKRPWFVRVSPISPLHAICTELGLALSSYLAPDEPEERFVAAHETWTWRLEEGLRASANGVDALLTDDPMRVVLSKLDRHWSRSVGASDLHAYAHHASPGAQLLDLRSLVTELLRRFKGAQRHHVTVSEFPLMVRDGKAAFVLTDARTGAGVHADSVIWEGDARAFRALSKDPAASQLVRSPQRVFRANVVTRGAPRTRSRIWLILPDSGAIVEVIAEPMQDGTTVWLLCTEASVHEVHSRRRMLKGLQDYVLQPEEHVLLADSVFDGLPVQLLDDGVLRAIDRADLRARGVAVEPEACDPKYMIAPYSLPPHQAHPATLRDLPVRFVGSALYPEWGFEGEVRSAAETADKLEPRRA